MSTSQKMRVGKYYYSPLFGNVKFGVSCLDRYSSGNPHFALDAVAPLGTALYAPMDCVVLDVYDKVPNPKYASTGSGKPCNGVVLGFTSSKGNRYSMSLHHLMKGVKVRKGQRLKAGAFVGRLGITGNTSGPHVHVNIWKGWGSWADRYRTLYKPKLRVSGKGFDTILRLGKTRSQVIKPAKVSSKPTPSKPKLPVVRLATVRARAVNRRKKGRALPKPSAQVKLWQRSLTKAGFTVPADGDYGPRTVAATKKFQRKQGWSGKAADGLPGVKTLQALARQKLFTT